MQYVWFCDLTVSCLYNCKLFDELWVDDMHDDFGLGRNIAWCNGHAMCCELTQNLRIRNLEKFSLDLEKSSHDFGSFVYGKIEPQFAEIEPRFCTDA